MRHLCKELVTALIVASFVFSPSAFAKQRRGSYAREAKPFYEALRLLKQNKKKPATFEELAGAGEHLLRRKEYKRFDRDARRFWDRKIGKVVVGKNYFKFKYGGKKVFGRFVDRGKVAFVLNNKPILWKDVVNYGRLNVRVREILSGKKRKKRTAFSEFLSYLSGKAHAREETEEGECEGGAARDAEGKCPEPAGSPVPAAVVSEKCRRVAALKKKTEAALDRGEKPDDIRPEFLRDLESCGLILVHPGPGAVIEKQPPGPEQEEEEAGGFFERNQDWLIPAAIITVFLIALLLHLLRDKDKAAPVVPTTPTPDPDPTEPPVEPPGEPIPDIPYIPDPGETTACPVGRNGVDSRGLSAEDFPGCISSCTETNTCEGDVVPGES